MGAGGPGSRFRVPLTLPSRVCRVRMAAAPLLCRARKEERSREMLVSWSISELAVVSESKLPPPVQPSWLHLPETA